MARTEQDACTEVMEEIRETIAGLEDVLKHELLVNYKGAQAIQRAVRLLHTLEEVLKG